MKGHYYSTKSNRQGRTCPWQLVSIYIVQHSDSQGCLLSESFPAAPLLRKKLGSKILPLSYIAKTVFVVLILQQKSSYSQFLISMDESKQDEICIGVKSNSVHRSKQILNSIEAHTWEYQQRHDSFFIEKNNQRLNKICLKLTSYFKKIKLRKRTIFLRIS